MNRVLLGALMVALIFPLSVAAAGADERSERDSAVTTVDFADGVTEDGILVARVAEDSPAQAAGIIRGDIVLEFETKEVNSIFELQNLLSDYEAGDEVQLLLSRGGDELALTLKLETRLNRPAIGIEAAPALGPGYRQLPRVSEMPGRTLGRGFAAPRRGFSNPPRDLSPPAEGPFMYRFFGEGDFRMMGYPGDIVTAVVEESPADRAGILKGDIIVRIGDYSLAETSVGEAIAELSPNDIVEIEIQRPSDGEDPETVVLTATLGTTDEGKAYLGIGYMPVRMRDMDALMERFGAEMPGMDGRGFGRPGADRFPEEVTPAPNL